MQSLGVPPIVVSQFSFAVITVNEGKVRVGVLDSVDMNLTNETARKRTYHADARALKRAKVATFT